MKDKLKKFWRKVRGIFLPEVMVGRHAPPPMNREQRRIKAALARKQPKGRKRQ